MLNNEFTFAISMSVLNHLGRNLYRNFATVLGEAISNAWDADASNVWITVDRDSNFFVIKDDGIGMDADSFQGKFLKIGYTKRSSGSESERGRTFIGRKGIGKLALLSCAERIHVVSKVEGGEYVGGVIDNSGLEEAIQDDLEPHNCPLGEVDQSVFKPYLADHQHGTLIYFEGIHDGIKNREEYLRQIIALFFRFSLIDSTFKIFMNNVQVTLDDLESLANKTQFLWRVNEHPDPYISQKLTRLVEPLKEMTVALPGLKGFLASVAKPGDLKIRGTDERVSVDLFVNGRMRERDILKHFPTARLAENYFYGQIHFDVLDEGDDRFTTSREGVIADDPKFKEFLKEVRKVLLKALEDWDKWRIKNRDEGDAENKRITKKERTARGLFNAVSGGYEPPPNSGRKKTVDKWVDSLGNDAAFNFQSYAECFVSENLIRRYIHEEKIELTREAKAEVEERKRQEVNKKATGNINIDLRRHNDDLSYLSMDYLSNMVDKTQTPNCLPSDAKQYKPMRDALMHTALLADEAKRRLTTVFENIQGRIKALVTAEK